MRRRYEQPIWEYNGKYYLEINAVTVKELPVEACFEKNNPYIIERWRTDYR